MAGGRYTQRMGIETNSHMCGTARAGHDPAENVLDASCRGHEIENLWSSGPERRAAVVTNVSTDVPGEPLGGARHIDAE